MAEPKLRILIDRLLEKSKSGILDWDVGPHSNEYIIVIGTNSIGIREYGGECTLYIYNESGEMVESISDMSPEGSFGKLTELHDLARRNALGADKIIDSLLDELDF
jgi:hypothetical protein